MKTKSSVISIKSLQEQLNLKTIKLTDLEPDQLMAILREKLKAITATSIINNAIKDGDKAPKFELIQINNCFNGNDRNDQESSLTRVRSKDLLQQGPLVVTFFRGDWCPYCTMTVETLELLYSELQKRGVNMVAISPQLMDTSSYAGKGSSKMPILCDIGNKVARKFRIAYDLDNLQVEILEAAMKVHVPTVNGKANSNPPMLPIPATYVIDRDGTVLYSCLECKYANRAELAEIMEVIDYATGTSWEQQQQQEEKQDEVFASNASEEAECGSV